MKKLLLLLLIAAGIWGYYEGSQDSGTIQESPRASAAVSSASSKSETISDVILSFVTDTVQDIFVSAIGGTKDETPAETPAAEETVETAPHGINPSDPVKPQAEETFLDEWNDIYEFKDALESRIDRTSFTPGNEIPDLMKNALIAAEDRRFYDHGALDIIGVARAAIANYTAGRTVEGGSTLSQQTVKNIFLSNERTMSRKIRELFLAVQLERMYTKDQILEIYLNTVYFGHGAYGIGQAAKTYFGKTPADLTLSEYALLAGLPQAPSAYDPIDYPEGGKKRMATVLMLMAREGYITPKEAAGAAFNVLLSN